MTTTYKGLTVLTPDPTGDGGLLLQNNLKALADRIPGTTTTSRAPTTTDDLAHGFYPFWHWIDSGTSKVYHCVSNTNNAAIWKEGGAVLPNNSAGYLQNNGSGTLSWSTPSNGLPSNSAGYLKNNGAGSLSWSAVDAFPANAAGYLKNNGTGTITWSAVDSNPKKTVEQHNDQYNVSLADHGKIISTAPVSVDPITYTLPEIDSTTVGTFFTFYKAEGLLLVEPQEGDTIAGEESLQANGTGVSITVVQVSDTEWAVIGQRGNWLNTGIDAQVTPVQDGQPAIHEVHRFSAVSIAGGSAVLTFQPGNIDVTVSAGEDWQSEIDSMVGPYAIQFSSDAENFYVEYLADYNSHTLLGVNYAGVEIPVAPSCQTYPGEEGVSNAYTNVYLNGATTGQIDVTVDGNTSQYSCSGGDYTINHASWEAPTVSVGINSSDPSRKAYSGTPERAVQTAAQSGQNEIQNIVITGATGGTYIVGFGGGSYTGEIEYTGGASALQTGIQTYWPDQPSSISVSGTGTEIDPYVVEFNNQLAGQDIATMSINTAGLT